MVSDELHEHYRYEYTDGAEYEWRRLGALDKADNIVSAWDGPRPNMIEIGCGEGAVGARLAELGFFASYRGFDISASGITEAQARNIPGATFTVFDGETIPAESADLVVMCHVLEHLEHPRQLLAEAHRLAPLLIAEVPLELNRGMPSDYDWNPVGHINKWNRDSFRQLIQSSRFDVLAQFTTNPSRAVQTYNSGPKGAVKWAMKATALRIAPKAARATFTYHDTLIARRNVRSHAAY